MHDLNLNGKFEKQWKVVEKAFQDFKDLNILPITIKNGEYVISEITEVSLEQQLNSLHNEKFTIAICGQVKAGKSTLLNSLFFTNISSNSNFNSLVRSLLVSII